MQCGERNLSMGTTTMDTTIMLALLVIAIAGITVTATIELVLWSPQQDANAKCRIGGTGYNASQGKCNPG